MGDSYARGYATRNRYHLPNSFEVSSYIKPRVSNDILIKAASTKIINLTKKDVVMFWGGSNDMAKNNSKTSLNNFLHFVKNNSHTNIILITVPHRFDLLDLPYVNNEF